MPTQLPRRTATPRIAARSRELSLLLLELAVVIFGLILSFDFPEYWDLLQQTMQGFLLLGV